MTGARPMSPGRMRVEKRGYTPELVLGVKREALEYARHEVVEGKRTWKEAARELGTTDRTLRRWRGLEERGGLVVARAGRPRRLLSRVTRRAVFRRVGECGPSIGVEPLRQCFEGLARSEAREIVAKYRAHYRRTHPRVVHELRWLVPGAVWAMDYTEGPRGEQLLCVRDLGLRKKLMWERVAGLGAEELVRVLKPVMAEERPLVVKVDGGAAFRSEVFEDFLGEHGVTILLSPPRRPEYNGSVESDIRWLKPITRDIAERWGGPRGEWTEAALQRARVMANELRMKIPGGGGGSPGAALRAAFRETLRVELEISEREALYGEAIPAGVALTLRRLAIERALVAHGILQVRRRMIPLPKRFLFAA